MFNHTDISTIYDAEQKIWSGTGSTRSYNDKLTVSQTIFNQLQIEAERTLQISITENTQLTRGQIFENANKISVFLRQEGLTQESHNVAILARNTTHLAALAFGCMFNGTPLQALNPNMEIPKICSILNITKPHLIFCVAEDHEKVKNISETLGVKVITYARSIEGVTSITDILQTSLQKDYKPECFQRSRDSTLAILNTSGSTGMPKAVTIPNNPILYDAFSYLSSNDVQYTANSIDWVTGLIKLITTGLHVALSIISEHPLSLADFMPICEQYSITWAMLGASQAAMLAASPHINAEQLKSLKYVPIVGGHLQATTLEKLDSNLQHKGVLCMAYGMTEVIAAMAFNYNTHKKPAAVGRLLPNIRMQIIEDGKPLGPNEVGEIYVNHGQHWSGYYGNALATSQMRDSDGWFHTGDMGYFDNDNYLYVVDRKKDLLKYMRNKYFPNEIEEVIAQMPEVVEVCVFGIYNELTGDAAAASVVIRDGCQLDAAQVVDFVARNIEANYKHLHEGVQIVANLAKSPNGKVNRKAVKEEFLKSKEIEKTI